MFRNKKGVLLFLLPGLIGLAVFSLAPFIGGLYYSMTDGTFQNNFVWFDNYRAIWQNEMFLLGLKNTMELSLFSSPAIWLLSFMLALMLKALDRRASFFRGALLLPYLMPSSALLLIWLLMFDYGGAINHLLSLLGLNRVLWLEGGALREFTVQPEDAGLPVHPFEDLLGGDPAENAAELKAVLSGGGRAAYRDAVLLNSAAALMVADRVSDLKTGAAMARESIESGAAAGKVAALAKLVPMG